MKRLCMLLLTVMISCTVTSQSNYNGTVWFGSKYQKKNLKRFVSGKRHKKFVPFKERSNVNHPTIKRETKKMMKQRYAEDLRTKFKY